MDGYMDTVDAISSHQPRERRLEILKDFLVRRGTRSMDFINNDVIKIIGRVLL